MSMLATLCSSQSLELRERYCVGSGLRHPPGSSQYLHSVQLAPCSICDFLLSKQSWLQALAFSARVRLV